ncbi:hypothetical protein FNV43_RR11248 [Rhamnella rubrinervis]|uniref:RING-type E3 ubiquitin transferase n=1 Tax=Rhamnella rubrinervis TaxID=2594499 RepID=A0A8K0H5S2_9ROSA|nr:hypothetical protein FNV43_RR11248 [Rhamnella rubrinervis]
MGTAFSLHFAHYVLVQLKEVLLEDADVAKAILEYINKNYINSIVVGASTRNAFARKFKGYDVPSSLVKTVPDFCSVYVVSKGKLMTARTAQRPVLNSVTPPKQIPSHGSEENGARGSLARGTWRNGGSDKIPPGRDRARSAPVNLSLDNIDIPSQSARSSFSRDSISDESDISGTRSSFGSMDITNQNLDFSSLPTSPNDTRQSAKDLEAEMKRLKLELKQTMDMYSSACKEAISAKNKAKELTQWKMEEARKFEEARLSEEAALAIAEIEKAKCKAAMEAAAMAQKLAEKEAQRRKQAEKAAKREAEEKNRALTVLSHNDVRYRKYTIEEIEAATDKPDAAQGRKQFQQEVEVLSCIRHPNMVLLLGACSEYGCLVYEYMNNGSLEDRLMRREPLVHRDLKPANILLDRNFVSKISDVGLARLVPQSVADQVTQYHMTSAAGTFCYIDPEYQQTGMLTTKSDIYSFGIMLLQIITGRPQWVLPTMFRVEEALAFAKLALQCTELRKKDRPDLGTVIVPELKRLKDFGKNAGADNVNLGRSGSGHSQNHMHRPP